MSRKRFYTTAAATPDGGIALDGKPVKTPGKQMLRVPSPALAIAIAAEWEAQRGTLEPERMILTKLANTALDRVAPERARIIDEMVEYAGSDLVCYRADRPPQLVMLQTSAWDPVLAWAHTALDAGFITIVGVVHKPQQATALEAVRRHLAAQDDFRLTALHNIMTLNGSCLLAAMIGACAILGDEAWAAAHVDEDYQIAEWGADDEALKRRAARQAEFAQCLRFLTLLKT